MKQHQEDTSDETFKKQKMISTLPFRTETQNSHFYEDIITHFCTNERAICINKDTKKSSVFVWKHSVNCKNAPLQKLLCYYVAVHQLSLMDKT